MAPFCSESRIVPGFAMQVAMCFWSELAPLLDAAQVARSAEDASSVREARGEPDEPATEKKPSAKEKRKKSSQRSAQGEAPEAAEKSPREAAESDEKTRKLDAETVLHLLDPYFDLVVDSQVPDILVASVCDNVFAKVPTQFLDPVSQQLFHSGSDEGVGKPERARVMAVVKHLKERMGTVSLKWD